MKYRSPSPLIHFKVFSPGSPKMETFNDLYFNKNFPGFSHRLTSQPSFFKAGKSHQNSSERSTNLGNIEIVFQNPSPYKVPRGKAPQKEHSPTLTKNQMSGSTSVISPLSISCSLFAHRKEAQEKLNAHANSRVKEPYVSLVETIQKHQALFKKPSKKFSLRDASHSPIRLTTGTKLNQIAIVNKKMMIPRQDSNLMLSELKNKSPRRIKTVSFAKRTIKHTQNQNDMSYDRNMFTNHQDLKGWDTFQDEEASVFHLLQRSEHC